MRLRDIYYRVWQNYDLAASIRQLRRMERWLPAPHSRFVIPFMFKGYGHFRRMRPVQSQWEIGELYHRVLRQRPRRVLEIGTARGGTLYLWCQAAQPDATIISVDLPGGQFGGGYRECCAEFYQSFKSPHQQLRLLRADSHSAETMHEVERLLGPDKVDFLFIDGDHTYGGVKTDFERYSRLVAPGGIIALHDIFPNADDPNIQVCRYWREIKQRFESTIELLSSAPGDRSIGIGVVEVPKAPAAVRSGQAAVGVA